MKDIIERIGPVDNRLRKIAINIGATLIDPADTLCSPTRCPAVQEDGTPIFKDASHLRASYTRSHFLALDQFITWK